MKKLVLWGLFLFGCLVGFSPAAEEPPEADAGVEETCNPDKLHSSAIYCLGNEPEGEELESCCLDTCLLCHSSPKDDPDLTAPTEWNSRGEVIAFVYATLAATGGQGVADLCIDCHDGHFTAEMNHPVDVAYQSDNENLKLKGSPEGVELVCTSEEAEGGGGCVMRCVTCHKVHPDESQGNQLLGLLRVNNAGSGLCLRCHDM